MTTTTGGGSSAIHGVGGAGDVARFVGSKERHDRGDFGRLSEPSRRNSLDHFLVGHRRIAAVAALHDRAQHAAVDQAGANAVDPHAGAGAFPRRTLGQPDHRMLAGAVDGDMRRSHQAGDRGGVDDAALVLLEHHRQHVFHAEEDADHVAVVRRLLRF